MNVTTADSSLLLYQTENGRQRIEVRLENGTVWLSQKLMAELFQTTPQNINMHLKNIFTEKEIDPNSVSKDSLITAADGKRYKTQVSCQPIFRFCGTTGSPQKSHVYGRLEVEIRCFPPSQR